MYQLSISRTVKVPTNLFETSRVRLIEIRDIEIRLYIFMLVSNVYWTYFEQHVRDFGKLGTSAMFKMLSMYLFCLPYKIIFYTVVVNSDFAVKKKNKSLSPKILFMGVTLLSKHQTTAEPLFFIISINTKCRKQLFRSRIKLKLVFLQSKILNVFKKCQQCFQKQLF